MMRMRRRRLSERATSGDPMNSPIETIHVSQTARDQLVKLKRYTGLKNWNIVCRWGFCASLAEPSPPPASRIPSDSSVEMTWRVFGGAHHELYLALTEAALQEGRAPA